MNGCMDILITTMPKTCWMMIFFSVVVFSLIILTIKVQRTVDHFFSVNMINFELELFQVCLFNNVWTIYCLIEFSNYWQWNCFQRKKKFKFFSFFFDKVIDQWSKKKKKIRQHSSLSKLWFFSHSWNEQKNLLIDWLDNKLFFLLLSFIYFSLRERKKQSKKINLLIVQKCYFLWK